MKIVIANGNQEADYIIKSFNSARNKLVVINKSKETANYLSKSNNIPVYWGDPSTQDVLTKAEVKKADLFIALGDSDPDCYVMCLLAKKFYEVKKCICLVTNPKHVDLFKTLGIDSPISSTHLLTQTIISESSLEDWIKTMSFEDDKVVLTDIKIKPSYRIANKMIKDINFPIIGNISCIYREPNVIIPHGSTVIKPKDKLMVISSPANQQEIIDFIQKPANPNE